MGRGRLLILTVLFGLLLAHLPISRPLSAQTSIREELARANVALESGDLEAADERLRAVLASTPDDSLKAVAEIGLARVFELRGDLNTALAHARLAEEAAPLDPSAAFFVGRLLAALGATNEAIAALDRARGLAPANPNSPLLAALLLRDDERVEEAANLLEEVWASGVDSPAVAEQIGALNLTLDRPERTIAIAREMLAADAEQAEFQLLLGLALAKDTDARSEAIGVLRRALALDPPKPALAWLELASLLLADGDHEAALAALVEAENLAPGNPEVYYRLGAAHRAAGNRDEAGRALARFQELRQQTDAAGSESKRLGTELNAAQQLANENRLVEALAKLDEILAAAPNNARVHTTRAKVAYSLGSSPDALESIARARQLDPGRAEHHFLEGIFLLDLRRVSEAEAALRRALDLDPDLDQAHVMLAGSLAKQSRFEEAASHFGQALALGADTLPLRLGYAAALEALGRDAESEEQMRAYRRLKDGSG